MSSCYFLSWKHARQGASAYAPGEPRLAHELVAELDGMEDLPFELELVKVTVGETGLAESSDLGGLESVWLDYQPNNLAWPLMSKRMRTVVSDNLTGKEGVDWVGARVNGAGEQRKYYIPRFERKLDVLDEQKTTYVRGTERVIRPCFSSRKISSLSMFHVPSANGLWKVPSGLYVKQGLRDAMQRERLTGLAFEKATVS
jgi:Immunity protein family (Imm11)